MRFFSLIKQVIGDFIFPKNRRIVELELLSPEKLQALLPKSSLPHALFDYSHPLVKELIWEIKYRGNRTLTSTVGKICYQNIDELGPVNLVPIPISDRRRFERGWNQTELICEAIKSCDTKQRIKYLPRQLVKVIHTESQTQTGSRKERLENLHQSMKVLNPLSVKDKLVLVIDDVSTTGATFKEAKRALLEAGAKKVLTLALAH